MELLDDVKRVLDKDEEIKFSFRPNKKRFIYINVIFSSLIILLFTSFPFFFGLFGLLGIVKFVNEEGLVDMVVPTVFTIIGSIGLIIFALNFIVGFVKYNKTIYVVTNKKILIRSGFIGADYNSLNHSSIGMMNVRVDFLDKLVKPNPGTIVFANASAPAVDRSGRSYTFAFTHIDNPYESYQEIKDYIDSIDQK